MINVQTSHYIKTFATLLIIFNIPTKLFSDLYLGKF